jgi:hypothetical protein
MFFRGEERGLEGECKRLTLDFSQANINIIIKIQENSKRSPPLTHTLIFFIHNAWDPRDFSKN